MDQFVQEQSLEGAAESKGSFTLSPALARKKLREHQLANPGSYILKIVQAAVRAGAPIIEVKAGRTTLEVSFVSSEAQLNDPQCLLESLLIAHSLTDSALRHLVVGINAASAKGMSKVRWETPQGSLVITPKSVKIEAGSSDRLRFVVEKDRSLLQWFRGTVYLDEVQLLNERCHYAKSEIHLDGRRLERPKDDRYRMCSTELSFEAPFYLMERLQAGSDDIWISGPPTEDYFWSEGYHRFLSSVKIETLCSYSEARPLLFSSDAGLERQEYSVEMGLAIRPMIEEIPLILFVKDGVLLEAHKEPELGHPGAVMLCSANGLDIDMSEFSIVANSKYREKLRGLQAFTIESTERVELANLKLAFQSLTTNQDVMEQMTTKWGNWLHHHALVPAQSIEELLWQYFSRKALKSAQELGEDGLASVRKIHQDHLPKEEEIIAIYDDTLIGTATLGFVITERRLCWKGTLDSARYIEWERLQTKDMTVENGKIQLMATEISLVLDNDIAPKLAKFLNQVGSLHLSFPTKLSPKDENIITLALSTLGKSRGVFYYPHIPRERLGAAMKAYLPTGEDKILVLYDDTMMGGGDNGFALTTESLSWMNIFESPSQLLWSDLKLDEIEATPNGLTVSSSPINIHRAEVRELAAQFFRLVASQEAAEEAV